MIRRSTYVSHPSVTSSIVSPFTTVTSSDLHLSRMYIIRFRLLAYRLDISPPVHHLNPQPGHKSLSLYNSVPQYSDRTPSPFSSSHIQGTALFIPAVPPRPTTRRICLGSRHCRPVGQHPTSLYALCSLASSIRSPSSSFSFGSILK